MLLAIAVSACMLSAQAVQYQTELTAGTSGNLILENDARSSIEAFHYKAQCGNGATEGSQDILGIQNGQFLGIVGDRPQHGPVRPWERVTFRENFYPNSSGCEWKVEVTAVLFSDGSYEGDKAQARAMQARRDGIVAAVGYWRAKMNPPPIKSSDFELLASDAKGRRTIDQANAWASKCFQGTDESCSYWQGRQLVDLNIANDIERKKINPDPEFTSPVEILDRWQEVLDRNEALRKLDAIFLLPAGIGERALAAGPAKR
jgi:hypothetical protein